MKKSSRMPSSSSRFGLRLCATLAITTGLFMAAAQAQTLHIGLAEDPDVLDPTMARTFVGRIVFATSSTSCRSWQPLTPGRRTTRP